VAGARDDRELRVRDVLREVVRDRAEVGLVVLPDHDEGRDLERLERCHLRARHLRLLVRGLPLDRPSLLRPHLVVMLGEDPEVEVHLGREVEVARVPSRLLRRPVVAHLLRPVPRRQPRRDHDQARDQLLLRERRAQRDRTAERVPDERRRQVRRDRVDERERLRRQRRLAPAGQVRRHHLVLARQRGDLPLPEPRVAEGGMEHDDLHPQDPSLSKMGRMAHVDVR
jgi:hypothetical protein